MCQDFVKSIRSAAPDLFAGIIKSGDLAIRFTGTVFVFGNKRRPLKKALWA